MGIGKVLSELMEEKGFNANEVAKIANISPQTLYSMIRRDSMKVDIEVLIKVSQALDVNVEYFYKKYINGNIDPLEKIRLIIEDAGFKLSSFVNPSNSIEYVRLLFKEGENKTKETWGSSLVFEKNDFIKEIINLCKQITDEYNKQKKDRLNAEIFKYIYLSGFNEKFETAEILSDSQYELMKSKQETTAGLTDEQIEKELESYRKELIAEKKKKTSLVSDGIKGA